MYKDVVGYEEYFTISEDGKVFSKRTNKELKQTKLKTGYMSFATKIGGRNGINKCFRVHILVAEAFISNPLNLPQVNHIDGNKENNHFSNLEWISPSDNLKHAYSLGLIQALKGPNNSQAKFTSNDVEEIRLLAPLHSYRKIGRMYGVSHNTISNILNNKTYTNV